MFGTSLVIPCHSRPARMVATSCALGWKLDICFICALVVYEGVRNTSPPSPWAMFRPGLQRCCVHVYRFPAYCNLPTMILPALSSLAFLLATAQATYVPKYTPASTPESDALASNALAQQPFYNASNHSGTCTVAKAYKRQEW